MIFEIMPIWCDSMQHKPDYSKLFKNEVTTIHGNSPYTIRFIAYKSTDCPTAWEIGPAALKVRALSTRESDRPLIVCVCNISGFC